MIAHNEMINRMRFYKYSYGELLQVHHKAPTVLEVCLYMSTIRRENVEKILEIMKKKEEIEKIEQGITNDEMDES